LIDIRRLLKNIITAGILTGFVLIAMLAILPVPARAEMANNLSNPGCVSCHTNYPTNHATTNCNTCHIGGPTLSAMWNCRYCHLTQVWDTYTPDYTGYMSGFRSWLDPLHNGPLGSKGWWQAGHYGNGGSQYLPPNPPRVDANFDYHKNSVYFPHTSVLPEPGCASCHKNTLTAAHEGKTHIVSNPMEDFEDGNFALNFTGYWGGEFSRVNETAYSGVYSFKSMTVGGSTRYPIPIPNATTEVAVNVGSKGNISLVYKVINSGKFSFYIDGVEMMANGASTTWTRLSYPLTAGTHTFKWKSTWSNVYIDDISVTGATTTYTMDCNTCHLSSDTSVKAAITNHSTNCSACHSAVDHEALHNGSLDISCQKCHKQVLTQEHMNNPVTTAGKNFDCNTCHSNTTSQVQRSLALGDLNCAGCHSTLHNFGAAEKTPADIPLYTGFSWTTPMDTAIFAGEPNIPSGFEQGWVLISNRKTDVTCLQVRNFYKTRAAVLGWTVGSDSAPSSATVDTIQFTKQNRMLVLRVYNTKLADGTGQQGLGYRIELWYK
jgi:hypothetical protein